MTENTLARAQARQRAIALVQQGQTDQAGKIIEELIRSEPTDALAWFCRGVLEQCLGHADGAMDAYRHALSLQPGLSNVNNNLGLLLEQQQRFEEAAKCYAAALVHNPVFVPALFNSGNVALKLERWADALEWFERALRLDPNMPQAHLGRGTALKELTRREEAIAALRQAIALKPDYVEAYNILGTMLKKFGKIAEAMQNFNKALQANPKSPETWINLGNAHLDRGEAAVARDCYLKAAQLAPEWEHASRAYSNYLLSLNYLQLPADEIFRAHCDWASRYARETEPLAHSNTPDPARRLRIGYVSPDFYDHPVAVFISPILEGHDRGAFEVVGFSDAQKPDDETHRLQLLMDKWHDISKLDDTKVANLVRSEQIDILVDLTGHTGLNRLGVFARRPAPVQVTYLGYPNTTGLHAMDFRISDPMADPPGMTDSWHTEKLARLPRSFLCYSPPATPHPVKPAPLERNGYVTFGSVANIAKISSETLDDWAAVLRELPDARLVLKRSGFRDESTRERMLRMFSERGIAPQRIELLFSKRPRGEHLDHYAGLDIVLDTFPYNGTTSLCEALWMGVPVITRYGRTHVSRVGLSLLTSIGLAELTGADHDEFVARTVALAKAPERVRDLRASLRDRVLNSPLCDKPGFVRELEQTYRRMWHEWCQTHETGN